VFTISNPGGTSATVSSVALGGANPGDFQQSATTCAAIPFPLAPTASCTVSYTFTPKALTARSATLTVTDTPDSLPPATSALSGTGIGITFTPATPINLGSYGVGIAGSPFTITINNTGTANLTFGSPSFSPFTGTNAADFAVSTDNCAAQTVVPSGNCTMLTTVTPSLIGAESANLNMNGNVVFSAALTATGQAGVLSTVPTSLTFPATVVGQHSPTQTFTLTNAGPGIVTISNIQTNGDFSQSNTCGATLGISGPAASCVFTVTFTPTQISAPNGRTGSVVITSNASNSPTTENLQGTGISVAQPNLIIKNGTTILNGLVIK
jgi:hypothetical protein